MREGARQEYRLAVRARRLLSALPLGPLHAARTGEDRVVVGVVSAVSAYHAARLGHEKFPSVPAILNAAGRVLSFRRSRRRDFIVTRA